MKKLSLIFLFLLCYSTSFAHYLWIETNPSGKLNQEQNVKIHYGEYTYGVIEKTDGEAFKSVAKFEVWVIHPDGTSTKLNLDKKEDYYSGSFTPTTNGVYTVQLKNDNIDVVDYSEYDFGIFKTYYQSFAKVKVGKTDAASTITEHGLSIKELPHKNEEKILQVNYKGQPLKEQEVKIYISDLWSKTLTTDAEGEISFKLPWNTTYTVETTKNEEVPGTYNGEDYEFIWHCATYCFPKK
ncbi:DUF4198 domain-containing protein [Zunongwangia endophytica]|uniref:DUF4198 domain-containing protein n=1 Tax=Zunongwangia endophytica TaxID=1808945 RepID=A0ABV8H4H4_9FLAO|nr:DUF4198 domain-containing protein [Zunongwangia endophytica]MDN3594300.1 DUF4198 domain-containing protein [Zunongwangia endophytica]